MRTLDTRTYYDTVRAAVEAPDAPGGYLWDAYEAPDSGYSWEGEYRSPQDTWEILTSDGSLTSAEAAEELAGWGYDDDEDKAQQLELVARGRVAEGQAEYQAKNQEQAGSGQGGTP